MPIGGTWLDIGAGRRVHGGWVGPSSEDLVSRVAYLAGCDVSRDVLTHPHLHDARVADAASLPWQSESFDLVSANMVVEHLSDPSRVFREVYRVLKPGSAFVFVTPNREYPVIRLAALIVAPRMRRWYGVHVERRPPEDVFVTEYRCNTVRDIAQLAMAVGFESELLESFRSEYPILPGALGRVEKWFGTIAARSARGRQLGADIIAVLRRPG